VHFYADVDLLRASLPIYDRARPERLFDRELCNIRSRMTWAD
jgi:hypothetical protein